MFGFFDGFPSAVRRQPNDTYGVPRRHYDAFGTPRHQYHPYDVDEEQLRAVQARKRQQAEHEALFRREQQVRAEEKRRANLLARAQQRAEAERRERQRMAELTAAATVVSAVWRGQRARTERDQKVAGMCEAVKTIENEVDAIWQSNGPDGWGSEKLDLQKRVLIETLVQQLLKLDGLQVRGSSEARKRRKIVVNRVNDLIEQAEGALLSQSALHDHTVADEMIMEATSADDTPQFKDKSVESEIKHFPFKCVADSDGKPLVEVQLHGETKQFHPEEISEAILGKMKETAEAYLGTISSSEEDQEDEEEEAHSEDEDSDLDTEPSDAHDDVLTDAFLASDMQLSDDEGCSERAGSESQPELEILREQLHETQKALQHEQDQNKRLRLQLQALYKKQRPHNSHHVGSHRGAYQKGKRSARRSLEGYLTEAANDADQ